MNHARGRLFLAALATIGLISGLVSAGPAAAATKYDWPPGQPNTCTVGVRPW